MTDPLPPGSTIGILGGGQLGRMLSVAAARLGLKTHIFEPGANPPAGQVADRVTTAGYDDTAALAAFAEAVDVVTYEFENIPTAALDALDPVRPVRPGRKALRVSQVFRASVVDTSLSSFVFELTGAPEKIDAFVELMAPLGLVDLARTGVAAITRGPEPM